MESARKEEQRPHEKSAPDVLDPDIRCPKISIITPSYNQGHFIEETILSILEQGYPNLEFIIIDGGSTDDTVNVIQRYADQITYWVSQPDHGQSDAINIGVAKATGDIIHWINSDDVLLPGALETIALAFNNQPRAEVVAGKTIRFGHGVEEHTVPKTMEHSSLEEELLLGWYMQPSTFFRAEVFRKLMPLNTTLSVAMDTDLFARYFLQFGRENVVHIDQALVRFRLHTDGKTLSRQFDFYSERFQIDLNVLKSCNASQPQSFGNLILEKKELSNYKVGQAIDTDRLQSVFHTKWGAWLADPSVKYLQAADYAGHMGDKGAMRRFSWQAIQHNPLNVKNYRYWLHTFLR